MHNFLVCAYKSQDFAQNLKNFARSHDRTTVTFRNSGQQYTNDKFSGKTVSQMIRDYSLKKVLLFWIPFHPNHEIN